MAGEGDARGVKARPVCVCAHVCVLYARPDFLCLSWIAWGTEMCALALPTCSLTPTLTHPCTLGRVPVHAWAHAHARMHRTHIRVCVRQEACDSF